MSEHELYQQIARYISLRYPSAIYRFDLAADLKLTLGQAAKHKKLHPRRGYPDLFIAEPVCVILNERRHEIGRYRIASKSGSETDLRGKHGVYFCGGLYLEIKKEGTRLKKKDGEWVSEHIAEQAEMLEDLRYRGYQAEFACGFDEAQEIIDNYLGGVEDENNRF